MKARSVITAVLLLFVAVSAAFLIAEQVARRPSADAEPNHSGPAEPTDAEAKPPASSPKVIAYYFHGNFRCETCRRIEAYAREAVEDAFADELANGTLEWRVVNVEERGNGHYVDDFQLVTRSLVLVAPGSEGPNAWKNLQEVWSLVRDKQAFQQYVRDEVLAFLGK